MPLWRRALDARAVQRRQPNAWRTVVGVTPGKWRDEDRFTLVLACGHIVERWTVPLRAFCEHCKAVRS